MCTQNEAEAVAADNIDDLPVALMMIARAQLPGSVCRGCACHSRASSGSRSSAASQTQRISRVESDNNTV
jgi:hypothetical protein